METDLTAVQMVELITQEVIDPNIKEQCALQTNNAPIELKSNETNSSKLESMIPNDSNNVVESVNDVIASQANTTIPVPNGVDKGTMKKVSKIKTTRKIPVLRITINKEYYKPEPLTPDEYKAIFLSNVVNNVIKKQAIASNPQNDINIKTETPATIAPPIFNLIPMATEHLTKGKHTGMDMKNDDISIPKTAYTRKGDLSRDNARNQTSAERLRYLYTKTHRDCDILKIRLKALRERHKHEQEEIKKLQMHERIFCKDVEDESLSDERLAKKKIFYSVEDREDEEEYQRLLREVREIKKEIVKKKYPVIKPIKRFKGSAKRGRKKMIKVNYTSKGNSVQNGEAVGGNYSNWNLVKTNGQPLPDFLPSNNESMCFEEEYLDQNLIG